MRIECIRDEQGFSLLDVLVASAILAVGLLSLAQLLAMTVAANASARRATYAVLLAAQKIEDLHAVPWEWLEGNTGESADVLDRAGTTLQGPPGAAAYTRRWSVDPLPVDPTNTLVIQVIVGTPRDEARIASVRTRTAP